MRKLGFENFSDKMIEILRKGLIQRLEHGFDAKELLTALQNETMHNNNADVLSAICAVLTFKLRPNYQSISQYGYREWTYSNYVLNQEGAPSFKKVVPVFYEFLLTHPFVCLLHPNPYDVLGVFPGCDEKTLTRAYDKTAQQWDLNRSTKKTKWSLFPGKIDDSLQPVKPDTKDGDDCYFDADHLTLQV